ncbi:MAG: SGNH/GDSL hydrolase family protein [Candidatus Hydrogenedentota bacterium]
MYIKLWIIHKKTKIITAFLGFIAGLIIIEIFYRITYLPPGSTTGYHSRLGWANYPNTKGIKLCVNNKIFYAYDNGGFRETGGPLNENNNNLLIIGDSFMDGIEVADTSHIQRYLREKLCDMGFNVYVYGVSGYGTDQEALYVIDSMKIYHWKVVGIAFFVGNDYGNNLEKYYKIATKTYYKPYFILEEGKIILKNVPVPREDINQLIYFLREHTSTYRYIKEMIFPRIEVLRRKWLAGNNPQLIVTSDFDDTKDREYSIKITEAILCYLNDELATNSVSFFVIIIPTKEQLREFRQYHSIKVLEEICSRHNIPYLNLYNIFLKLSQNPANEFYIESEGHFSEKGHYIISLAIVDFLKKQMENNT